MRLLFVSNLFPPFSLGGYEQICADIAGGLRLRGHYVHILTSTYRGADIEAPEPHVERLLKLRGSWISPPEGRTTALGRNRLEVDRHNYQNFVRTSERLRPDAVMIWNGGHLGPALLWAAEQRGRAAYYLSDAWLAPLLAQQRPDAHNPPARRAYRAALARLTTTARPIAGQNLIFCSEALRGQYRALGTDVGGSTVIYHGISVEEFRSGPQRILEGDATTPRRLLYMGRLAPDKGVTTLVRAFAALRQMPHMTGTRLTLVGGFHDEDYARTLGALIGELELSERVDMPGHRPRAEIPEILGEHDALVFPSEWEEPFALTLLQAMAVGLPVISSLRGGSADIVRDGENALAFRARDVEDLTRAMHTILTQREEAAAMGRRASVEVRTRYTLVGQLDAVEAFLSRTVESGGAPGSGGKPVM